MPFRQTEADNHSVISGNNTGTGVGVFGVHRTSRNFGALGVQINEATVLPEDPSAGEVSLPSAGVFGQSERGDGVVGRSVRANGVLGTSRRGTALVGFSDAGDGVFARAEHLTEATRGVTGMTDSENRRSVGVLGFNNGGDGQGVGVQGVCTSGRWGASGVFGLAASTSGEAAGVWGTTRSPNGFGVISMGNAFVRGDVRVTGRKHAIVETSQGARAVHCEESPEAWFCDYGFGRIEAGEEAAVVEIEGLFAETVNLDQLFHVFVQAYGRANLFVRTRTATGFEVCRLDGKPSETAVEFSYRVVAKRRGYESERLEEVSIPEPPEREDIDVDAITPDGWSRADRGLDPGESEGERAR